MQKINRPDLSTIDSLTILQENFESWGNEFKIYLDTNKREGVGFSWRRNIYKSLRNELGQLTDFHCSFCDSYPFDMSKETIEHFYPKNEYPLKAYLWENLFYCCDKCQSNANKSPFQESLQPDKNSYTFESIFYIDLLDFQIKVLEILEVDNKILYNKANLFLERYGINESSRQARRRNLYRDLKLYFDMEHGTPNARIRDDFPFRYMFDIVQSIPK